MKRTQTISTQRKRIQKKRKLAAQPKWDNSPRKVIHLMAVWIWLVMYGNGATIGSMKMNTKTVKMRKTRKVRNLGHLACCGVARGSSALTSRALPSVAGSIRRLRASTLVFVVPAHFLCCNSGFWFSDLLKRVLFLLFFFSSRRRRVAQENLRGL